MELRIYSVGAKAGALGPHPDSIPFPEHKHLSSVYPCCWVYVRSHIDALVLQRLFPGGNIPLKDRGRTIRYLGPQKGRVAKWCRLGQGAVEQGLGRRGPETQVRSLGRPGAGPRLAMVSSTFSMKAFDDVQSLS